ncbi:M23 family metallopeptidase [Sphingomonas sp. KR1UV-12]|uniref:M23 family metallopeptidase n=1 Tax=Sphingomonas aurea TaxID=3063994 RepID=A0ABT9EH37_9SPHN|nr:M23 family metallopeptidase [Sphingomonas sp. KR1UV-12]MDP1026086.1 M23 family metallopeptidase [Sphingomonas sp. KR1UV-12]
MSRIGWIFLALVVLAALAFGSMLSFGGGHGAPVPTTEQAVPADPAGDLLPVPVSGVPRSAIADSWGDARDGGGRAHHGTDIMAPGGAPVIAAAPGRVEKLFHSDAGGITAYVRSLDGRWSYYYAHLSGYAPGLAEGQAVRAGDPIGFVGDTGNAGAGNTHLHFGLSRMAAGEKWWGGEPVDPYPLLAGRAARR